MQKQYFDINDNHFYGAYYPIENSKYAMILVIGNKCDNYLVKSCVKWLHKQNLNVLALAPTKEENSYHNIPIERFKYAIDYLLKDNLKVGIIGASITGMVSLVVASYFNEISLTISLTPCDFIAEGYLRDNLDNASERPANQSTLTYQNKPLPYLPYAYRHPLYWEKIMEESKNSGNKIACFEMFEESERLNPLKEEQKIKVENIKGHLILVGARDDSLWNCSKYIDRMSKRINNPLAHYFVYDHGTHFLCPQTLISKAIPLVSTLFIKIFFKDGKKYAKECKNNRIDLEEKIINIIELWKNS